VRESSIAKQYGWGGETDFARAIGGELRRRRRAKGWTQAQLGDPLTKGFVSAVELGHVVPSLPALALMADRLEMPLAELFESVKNEWPGVYTPAHDDRSTPAHRGR
jgi:transcriptional regulator with XRE-family HTH domain